MKFIHCLTFIKKKNDLLNFQILIDESQYSQFITFINNQDQYFNNMNVDYAFVFKKKDWINFGLFPDFNFNDFSYIGTDIVKIENLKTYDEDLKNQYYSLTNGPLGIHYNFHEPIDGRIVDYDGLYYKLWYHEYGLFKRINTNYKNYGFYNPETGLLVMKNEKDYKMVKRKMENMDIKKKEQNFKFLRVISVYDKFNKTLRYRIINDFFSIIPLSNFIEHYENDELYLRAYEITNEIYEDLIITVNEAFDFDFSRNSYFFETIKAEELLYNYTVV